MELWREGERLSVVSARYRSQNRRTDGPNLQVIISRRRSSSACTRATDGQKRQCSTEKGILLAFRLKNLSEINSGNFGWNTEITERDHFGRKTPSAEKLFRFRPRLFRLITSRNHKFPVFLPDAVLCHNNQRRRPSPRSTCATRALMLCVTAAGSDE